MNRKIRIGIIGCGAIGSSLAKIIKKDFKARAHVAAIFDIDEKKSFTLARKLGYNNVVVQSRRDLIKRADLVIEATHMKFAYDIAKDAISSSKDIMIMSVGGIVARYKSLVQLAKRKKSKIYIPSGAVCGIDGLKALAFAKIKKVKLTTTKPVKSFDGVEFVKKRFGALDNINRDKILFSGPAEKAIQFFPQNINVAAILSLAGIGIKKTEICIIASPKIKKNIHNIEIDSDAGRISARTENIPHPDNPKTSFLAVLSATAMLKQIFEPIRLGS